MRVFGIGLNKTGTTTLARALSHLGFDKAFGYDLGLTRLYFNGEKELIINKAKQGNNFQDWPWPLMYKDLYDQFPEAKFVLTKRKSSKTWFQSLCKHALLTGPTEARKLIYGHYMPQEFEQEHLDFYEKHNEEVSAFFKKMSPENFLVICWEEGDNWKELCLFLNKSIPGIKFPHLNKAL